MKRRTWLHAVALGLVLVVGSLGPGLPTYAATSSAKAADYLFAFKDAELSQVAEQILGRTLGVNYLVDPSLNVRLSFRIEQRLTQPQLIEAFEAVLAANDIAMVREGDTLMLKPRGKAKVGAPLRVPGEAPHRAGYEVVAVPLNFASAAEVAKALESIAPPNTVLYANDKTGLLLLGGSGAELQSALQSVKVFDQDGLAESKIRWFEIREAPVTTVADDLKRLLDGASVQGVSIIPLKRLNGLFVFARSEEALKQVEKWIARLDTPSQDKSSSFWVYHPRNVSAEDLAGSLGSLMGEDGGLRPGQLPKRLDKRIIFAAGLELERHRRQMGRAQPWRFRSRQGRDHRSTATHHGDLQALTQSFFSHGEIAMTEGPAREHGAVRLIPLTALETVNRLGKGSLPRLGVRRPRQFAKAPSHANGAHQEDETRQ